MRYNIFNHAHQPLKLALLSTCISFGRNEDCNILAATKAIRKVEETLHVFNEQLNFETYRIMPLVFEYEPSVWSLYTSEHCKARNLSDNLENLIQSFHTSKSANDKLIVVEAADKMFNEFVLFNYNHMDDEEAVLNEILWRYYNDSVISETGMEIQELTQFITQYNKIEELQIATAA